MEKRIEEILEEVFNTGVATKTFDLIPDKLSVTVVTINSEDQLALEKAIPEETGGQWYMIHKYSRNMLKYTVKKYGTKTFGTADAAEDFLKTLSGSILDRLIKEQSALEKELRTALGLENVEEHFFVKDELETGSEQSSKESNSANPEA
jgi:hypothetical protein